MLTWLESIESDDAPLLGKNGRITLDSEANLVGLLGHAPGDGHEIRNIAQAIDAAIKDMIVARPELFLFGCYSHIVSLINDYTIPAAVRYLDPTDTKYHMLRRHLYILLTNNRSVFRSVMAKRTEAVKQVIRTTHRPNSGGFIQNTRKDLGQVPDPKVFEENVIHLDLLQAPQHTKCFYRVRWHRESLYWSYTFFESPRSMPIALNESTIKHAEIPYLNLNQQTSTVLNDYTRDVSVYMAMLIHIFIKPTAKESHFLANLINQARAATIPGQHLATAHYAFIPLGILVLLLYFPEWSLRMARDYLPQVRIGLDTIQYESVRNDLISIISELHKEKDFRVFVTVLREYPGENISRVANICEHALKHGEDDTQARAPNVIDFLCLGGQLYDKAIECSVENRDLFPRIGDSIVRLCAMFWRALGSCHQISKQEDWNNKNYLDFVSCYVESHRGIYFTNFQPTGSDRSTKTLFIDLAFTGFQRAQLAQRLCDISTYRNISLKDIDRVRAIMWSMNEINIELNDLLGGSKITFRSDADSILKEEEECQRLISRLDEIRQQLDLMNQFIVYGVSGRRAASDDFLDQIRERTRDNRQNEITNFPELEDFLERRVADGIRDAERMSETYDYIGNRIAESFSRVRTRLNFIQTANAAAFSRSTAQIMRELSSTAQSNKLQTRQLVKSVGVMNKQTSSLLQVSEEQRLHSVELNRINEMQARWNIVLVVVGAANLAYITYSFVEWNFVLTNTEKRFYSLSAIVVSGMVVAVTPLVIRWWRRSRPKPTIVTELANTPAK